MRIIAGKHRGRTILGPKDANTTRPITDRVKTALFDRLCHSYHLLGPDEGGRVLDVFAGTGSMGLEALSRGAEEAVFVEQDREALRRLNKNLADLGEKDRAEVLRVSALHATWVLQLPRRFHGSVRVAFVDPPYRMLEGEGWSKLEPLFEAIAEVAEPGGAMVLRTEKRQDIAPVAGWGEPETYRYGSMKLHFFVRPGAGEQAADVE
ncbi:MAG: RsmD family RNA methyltransferase [Phycisphaeraceae bacterium]